MMKFLVLVLAFAVFTQAADIRPRSQDFVKPRHPFEGLNPLLPADERIIGGSEATPNQYPWQTALLLSNAAGNTFFCGGSLISSRWVLTAAHCVDGVVSVEVILGAQRHQADEPTQQRLTSTRLIAHQNYSSAIIVNDVAVIELPTDATLNEFVNIIQLDPIDAPNHVNERANITGWGKTSDGAAGVSAVLKTVDVQVVDNSVCVDYYGALIFGERKICIGTNLGTEGSCNGDSGGPLIQSYVGSTTPPTARQIGIVSFGSSAGCESGAPDGFTRISSYRNWILQTTGV